MLPVVCCHSDFDTLKPHVACCLLSVRFPDVLKALNACRLLLFGFPDVLKAHVARHLLLFRFSVVLSPMLPVVCCCLDILMY